MNFQKIALKQLLKDRNVQLLNKLTPNLFSGAYKNIVRLFDTYYSKHNKLPTKDDIIALFQSKLPKDKAETYTAIIDSLNKIESELNTDELLSELRYDSVAKSVDSEVAKIVELAENKDLDKLKVVLLDLQNKINKVDDSGVDDILNVDFKNVNLSYIDNCLDTLRDRGINFTGLSIIGAKSSGGKSLLSLQQALYTYEQGHSVGFLSLELDESLLLTRMYSQINKTNYKELLQNSSKKELIDKWKVKYFDRENKFYIKHKRYTISGLKDTIKDLIDKGVKLIVIDYLNLVAFDSVNDEWKSLANLVKELHQLAIESGVVILSPTQVNLEVSKNGHIQISSRGSQELIYSSSLFLVIYQDKEERAENVSRIIVEKARNAQKITCMVKNDFDTMSFTDLYTVIE